MNAQSIYHALPVPFQNLALSAYAVVLQQRYYGGKFHQWCDRYDQQERWSRSQMETYQLDRLQEILSNAYSFIPHYRQSFQQSNIKPSDLRKMEDLCIFPILEKDVLRTKPISLVDERIDVRRLKTDRTSGSTGSPLIVYWNRDMFPAWWALQERRVRAWAGVSQSMPRAMIGGRTICRGSSPGPYWRYNATWRQLYLSSYHISPQTAPSYVSAIRRFGSTWITGYGSAIALLGEWLCKNPQELPEIKAAVTSGDNLLPNHRRYIEEGFGCRVFDNYGSAEGCLVISECSHGNLHVQPESGILEILDETGKPCKPGEIGEMIVTGLLNESMPLIRYRTGDLAAWSENTQCPCGRQSPIVSHIEGRVDDYLLLPDGRKIGRLSTAFKKSLTIRSAQLLQDRIDHAWLLIVPGEDYEPSHGITIRDDILSRIGDFPIDIRIVPSIPRTRSGKQRLVVRTFDNSEATQYLTQLPGTLWNN